MPFADKFYYQQMFKVSDLPDQIVSEIKKTKDPKLLQYSENMIVYTGRKGLHIFDIDRERWAFNSKKSGYNYQEIYYKAKGIENSDDEMGYPEVLSDEEFNESGEDENSEGSSSSSSISQIGSGNNSDDNFDFGSLFTEILLQIKQQIIDVCQV